MGVHHAVVILEGLCGHDVGNYLRLRVMPE